jgi:hypothetical protein
MKTKSPLLIAISAFALFVLVTFPGATALAKCGQVYDVIVYYEYDGPTGIQVEMEVEYPTGATIYFTLNGTNPTHDSSGNPGSGTYIYYGPMSVAYHHCLNVKARAWKPGINPCWYDSVNIVYENICNPIQ